MSILEAMYSGVSGLSAESEALGVVGDNISNENTVGFKQSRANFEDVLGGAVGPNQVGNGVRIGRIQQIFAQGTMLNTGNPTDLALSGDGFFVVNGDIGGAAGNYYTRAGQTSLTADGTLVNSDGYALQGYKANADGSFSSQLGSIKVTTGQLPPKASDKMDVTANLDSTTPAGTWDPTNLTDKSNYSTSMTTYDSLGNAHNVDVYFHNDGGGKWEVHMFAPGEDVQGGTAGTPQEIGSGELQFDSNGALTSNSLTSVNVTFNGASAQTIAVNLGSATSGGGSGTDGITQYASTSEVGSQDQNGYGSGSLSGVKVDNNGVVSGVYTNGQSVAFGQLAVAKFVSNDGLARTGQNCWAATQASGQAALGTAGSGGRASISSGQLEQSNVDIATQFVDLIAHQRAFQANSKTITTADQMLQDLMNIKQ